VTDEFDMGGSSSDMSDALMYLMEMVVQPVLSAVAGYRAQLSRMGFADAVADEMAAEFNSVLMDKVRIILAKAGEQ
jgi:hypothetical protein